jgi:hypothetical protein
MASVSIFDTLRQRVLRSQGLLPLERRAMFWFSEYAQALRSWQRTWRNRSFDKVQHDQFSKEIVPGQSVEAGYLYFFLYDPKGQTSLPYYDQFPFVLVLDSDPTSFLGLNFHYLDYEWRARLFDALWPFRDNTPGHTQDRLIQLRVTYDLLVSSSKYKYFRPCLKRYLISHIQSPLLKVGASEWDLAIFLPVESFMKETRQSVWRESEKKFT